MHLDLLPIEAKVKKKSFSAFEELKHFFMVRKHSLSRQLELGLFVCLFVYPLMLPGWHLMN